MTGRSGATRAGVRSTGALGLVLALAVTLAGPALPAAAAGAPPVAAPDTATVVSGQSVTVSPLANDSDPNGEPISLVSATLTSGAGTVTAAGNDVTIATTPGYVGPLVVTYVIADTTAPALSATSTITVDVQAPPNTPPVANPDTASMVAGTELRLDPRGNDSDPDGDALSVLAATVDPATGATVTVEGGTTLVIRAAAGYVGPLTVGYTLADARGAQAAGVVTITVTAATSNRAPTAVADAATVSQGRSVRVPVLANDSDPDGDRLTLVKVRSPKHGSARVSKGAVVYRAPKKFAGTVTITYTVRDSHRARSTAKLTITVQGKAARQPTPATPAKASRAAVESALARLGLPVGSVNGGYDSRTRRAVCAWRTIVGRTASRANPSAAEAAAIVATDRLPAARDTMVTGVTVSVTCQTAFWVGANRQYKRVMPACTGKPGYRTRLGTFRVFLTYHTWRRSTIYPEARMYKPMQFSGGQALHGSATDAWVNTTPSSHGCVRMLHRDIDALQDGGVGNGTLVRVIGHW